MWILLPLLLLTACATVESDSSSFDQLMMARTRVDFAPISRPERDKLLQYEKHVLDTSTAPIRAEMAEAAEARRKRYDEIKRQFPTCENQKHCISSLSRGREQDFERYTRLNKSLQEFDLKVIELDGAIQAWENRYELRARAINNRFLVHEMLQLPKVEPRIAKVTVHSLEAFDSRRTLAERLLRVADVDAVATIWGDLNFRMLGRPVDEAAVMAAFDVWVTQAGDDRKLARRFVVNFLVNGQRVDSFAYDRGFLKYWAGTFVDHEQKSLRERALCALYSIAGETLAAKLPSAKAERCAPERNRMQNPPKGMQFAAEDWLLPIGYFHASEK